MKPSNEIAGAEICFEDLTGAEEFRSALLKITKRAITTFATRYDRQPFHLTEAAGKESIFGGLVASGWMTAALTMRLFFEGEPKLAGGGIGLGIDSVKWKLPVRPGDRLTVRSTILSKRLSNSWPDHGILKLRTVTVNQRGEAVQIIVARLLVRRRQTPSPL